MLEVERCEFYFFHSIEHELNHVYHVISLNLLIVMKLNGVY